MCILPDFSIEVPIIQTKKTKTSKIFLNTVLSMFTNLTRRNYLELLNAPFMKKH